jgi:hypothetical protein
MHSIAFALANGVSDSHYIVYKISPSHPVRGDFDDDPYSLSIDRDTASVRTGRDTRRAELRPDYWQSIKRMHGYTQ